jgi:hypothetical protein
VSHSGFVSSSSAVYDLDDRSHRRFPQATSCCHFEAKALSKVFCLHIWEVVQSEMSVDIFERPFRDDGRPTIANSITGGPTDRLSATSSVNLV